MIEPGRVEDSKGIDFDKTYKSKECKISYYNYFDNCFKSDSEICNRCDWGIKSFGNFAIIHVNDFSYTFFIFETTEEDVIESIKDFEPDDQFETKLQYEKIDISEEIDIDKTSLSREYIICHYWYFKDVGICNERSIGCIFSGSKRVEISDVKGVDYVCVIWYWQK